MNHETRWQRAMIDGLGLDSLFVQAQLGIPARRQRADIKPTKAEIDRAIANIRTWKEYLPPSCVAAMIKDGWQWST